MRHTHSATQPPEVTCAHPDHRKEEPMPSPSAPTPGPWHVDDHDQAANAYGGPIIRSEGGMRIACVMGSNLFPDGYRDADANARLIAAAPRVAQEHAEMLALLPDLMKAADELMTEYVSKKRAANWGLINDALYRAGTLLARVGKE